ncbi:MAG: hypothetical protein ACLUSP_08460 [Christensenellales bacterium]
MCYTDSSLGYPVIRNTAEMYAENPTADLKEKSCFTPRASPAEQTTTK